jgi:hypothetical protein
MKREAAGLHGSVMPWMKQRDISLLAGDGVNDVQPSGVVGAGEAANRPIHTLADRGARGAAGGQRVSRGRGTPSGQPQAVGISDDRAVHACARWHGDFI